MDGAAPAMIPASIETGDREAPLTNKAYEKELRRLQAELCHMQEWIKTTGQRIIVVFEGRDAAGKGGIIKAITKGVSPQSVMISSVRPR
jgi:polyphosphate kinase